MRSKFQIYELVVPSYLKHVKETIIRVGGWANQLQSDTWHYAHQPTLKYPMSYDEFDTPSHPIFCLIHGIKCQISHVHYPCIPIGLHYHNRLAIKSDKRKLYSLDTVPSSSISTVNGSFFTTGLASSCRGWEESPVTE